MLPTAMKLFPKAKIKHSLCYIINLINLYQNQNVTHSIGRNKEALEDIKKALKGTKIPDVTRRYNVSMLNIDMFDLILLRI